MKAEEIKTKIDKYIRDYSGLDQSRNYLGISKIPLCPRQAVLEYRSGIDTGPETVHRFCYADYEQEASIYKILLGSNVALVLKDNEVVAPFDQRLRGHVDGETVDGELIEIKSVSTEKFKQVSGRSHPLWKHYIQVQLYMRYGHWLDCFAIYRCRETYEHIIIPVPYDDSQAIKFENKAKELLEHIDHGTLPACECGRHNIV